MFSHWTYGDHSSLTVQALELDLEAGYCEHCTVIPITPGDRYCLACAQEITDYLAQVHKEQQSCDKGLY
jgi:hypothetical protein